MRKAIAVIITGGLLFLYFTMWVYMPKNNIILFEGVMFGHIFFIPISMWIWKFVTKSQIKTRTLGIVTIITIVIYVIIFYTLTRGWFYYYNLKERGLL
jgi:hypothetical protein